MTLADVPPDAHPVRVRSATTMGLQQFERRLERLVEGVFAKAFRSGLQPVEIGRRLAREMDLRRQVAPKGTLAPNSFVVSLSPEDRARFEPIEEELIAELVSVAKDHAHTESYGFIGRVEVALETDKDLSPGMLLVAGDMARSQRPRDSGAGRSRPRSGRPAASSPDPPGRPRPRPGGAPGRTLRRDEVDESKADNEGGQPEPQPAEDFEDFDHNDESDEPAGATSGGRGPGSERRRDDATLVLPDGRRLVLGAKGLVMGRLPECGLVLADPNVSRRHAEVRPAGGGRFEVTDLGSTNGTKVNGTKVRGVQLLQDGDGVTVGATTLRFEQG